MLTTNFIDICTTFIIYYLFALWNIFHVFVCGTFWFIALFALWQIICVMLATATRFHQGPVARQIFLFPFMQRQLHVCVSSLLPMLQLLVLFSIWYFDKLRNSKSVTATWHSLFVLLREINSILLFLPFATIGARRCCCHSLRLPHPPAPQLFGLSDCFSCAFNEP